MISFAVQLNLLEFFFFLTILFLKKRIGGSCQSLYSFCHVYSGTVFLESFLYALELIAT